jgi:signal transduction histidine kinase
MEAWRRSVVTGEMFEIEYRLRRYDGAYRWTLGRALPLHDADGQIIRWFGTCTDIDDTKQAAEVLARGRAELERLVEARTAALLREMDERRKAEEALRQGEKLQAIGQLTGGIAHDFNNILQVVMSGATLLGRPNLPEQRRLAVLEGMTGAAQSAKELTGRLLAFARKQSLRPEPFDLNARLAGMSELLRHTLGSLITVETSFADNLWWAVADVSQLEVAILNLAMNARDAMLPKGGVLLFETRNATLPGTADRNAGDFVSMTVRDSGMGMPPSVLARVFEPFFTTKGLGQGTGLGLAQVHGFSKQSGGDIAIESVPGEGTTITLHLPRAAVGRSARIGRAPAPIATHPLTQSAGSCVLVVDDNADVAAFAVSMLEELGYSARCVGNAKDALAMLDDGAQVDVVFTDVVMPGDMNGMEMAALLKATRPEIGLVMASGYSEVEPDVGLGVTLLSKPYRLEELAEAVLRALSGRQ